jgi:membrane protease YdiL (CAAX protease family)
MLRFLVLTFLAAWAFFVPLALFPELGPVAAVVAALGAYTPSVIALWLTNRSDGRAGVEALVARVFRLRVAVRWYVFAAGYMVAVKLVVALIHRGATGVWPRFGDEPWFLMLVALVVSTPFQAGEEIGWRGYALPRLASRMGLARASLLLGLVWAVWHLPLFFVQAAGTYHQSFPMYTLQVIALSVTFTWLYVRTGGSLALVMLLHAAINNTKDIVPSVMEGATQTFGLTASLVGWLTVAVLWVPALYFLCIFRRYRLV